MIRSGKIFPLVLVAAAVAFIAFGLLSVLGGGNTVSGKVVSVDSASVTTISSLTIEDSGRSEGQERSPDLLRHTSRNIVRYRNL